MNDPTKEQIELATRRYLADELLDATELDILARHVRHWINSPQWDAMPDAGGEAYAGELLILRATCYAFADTAAAREWIERARSLNLAPF